MINGHVTSLSYADCTNQKSNEYLNQKIHSMGGGGYIDLQD